MRTSDFKGVKDLVLKHAITEVFACTSSVLAMRMDIDIDRFRTLGFKEQIIPDILHLLMQEMTDNTLKMSTTKITTEWLFMFIHN